VSAIPGTKSFYGWPLLFFLWVILGINFALTNYGMSILNVYLGDELNFSRSALGFGYSVYMLMTGLPGPLVAKLIDRVGIRYTLVIGNIMLVLGAISMATIVTSPLMLVLIGGILMGLAHSNGGPIPVQASVTRWFSRRRSIAMALVLSGASAGGMIFPSMIGYIVANTDSWRFAWWVIAGLAVISTLISFFLVRERPEEVGQYPDGDAASSGESAPVTNGKPRSRVYQTTEDWSVHDVLRAPAFWLLLCCSISVVASYSMFLGQGVLHIRDLGHSIELASYLFSFSVGSGLVARLVAGYLGDKIDAKLLWVVGLLSQGLGLAIFAQAHTLVLLYVAVACLGVGSGIAILSIVLVFGNWFGPRAAPFVFGYGSAFAAAFGALIPVIAGILFDMTGSFIPIFYGISGLSILTAITLAMLKPPRIARKAGKLA